jgi:hypothetical protein
VLALDKVLAVEFVGSPLRALVNDVLERMVGAKLALKLPTTAVLPPPEVDWAPDPAVPLGLTNPSTVNAVRSLSVRSMIGAPNAVSIGVGTAAAGCLFALGVSLPWPGDGWIATSEANAAVPLRVNTPAAIAAVALRAFLWWDFVDADIAVPSVRREESFADRLALDVSYLKSPLNRVFPYNKIA